MKKLLLFFTLTFVISSFSQQNRKAFSLEIAADETHQYGANIPESPYFVKEKFLQIYCGEKVFIECEIAGDSISTMKIVTENIHPKKTIEIEFTQNAEDRTNISTMLLLNNPFKWDLTYEAIMLTPVSQEWSETSTIPVRAKLMSFETWGHSIISLGLMNWQFKKP